MTEKKFEITWDRYYLGVLYKNFGKNPYLVLEDGTEVFRDDVAHMYTFFDYYDDKISNGFFDKHDSPYMIATGAGTMPQIEDMMLTTAERDKILEHGLKIYFYEIVWYHSGTPKKFLIRNVPDYHPRDFNFELADNQQDFFCFDLDCVNVFMHKNNIPSVEVIVRDHGLGKFVDKKYPRIKVRYRENYIATLTGTSDTASSYDLCDSMQENLKSDCIKHKFWCGNWRYADHRLMMAAFLVRLDCKLSWAYKIDLEQTAYWTMLDQWQHTDPVLFTKIKTGAELLNSSGPFVLDILFQQTIVDESKLFHRPTVIGREYRCPTVLSLPFDTYTECFCAVVNESEFRRPTANISEKVINAIKACRPFVLVSSPHSLAWLKRLGFKTFDRIWNEDYDAVENHEQRLKKIFELIEYIDSKSVEELRNMYESIGDILEHNFKNLSNLRNMDTCDL